MRAIVITILSLLISSVAWSQEERKLTRKGNKSYSKNDFQDAEIDYRKALVENPQYPEGQFNLGDAIYQQQRYEESIQPFEQILAQTESEEMKAWTHHNLGNAQLEAKKYSEAIESYKDALRIRPDDHDTKYNLAYAQQMLGQQQQNGGDGENQQDQEQNQDEQQNQDQQNEQDQDQQQDQNQEGEQNEQEQQENNEGQGKQEDQSNEEQQKQPKPNQLSKEEAERILQALQNEEQKVQAKVQKEKGKPSKIYIEKDW